MSFPTSSPTSENTSNMSTNVSWIPTAPATFWSSPNDQFSTWPKLAVLALSTLVIHRLYKSASLNMKLPPGPRGWPVIGSVFDIGPHMWLTFTEWKKQYGEYFGYELVWQACSLMCALCRTDFLCEPRRAFNDRLEHPRSRHGAPR